MTKNGIHCEIGKRQIHLDPKRCKDGVNFVSHAHADHLPSKTDTTILASPETRELASLRGLELNHTASQDGFTMIDTGHVLGSRGLLFDDIFYTGDICTRDRGFLKKAEIPRCKTLITECTFGLPEFIFPKLDDIIQKVNEIISNLYEKGIPVILMGHKLGKAQTITNLFGHWGPLYLHDSIMEINKLYQRFNVALRDGISYTEAKNKGCLDKKPWIMIAPRLPGKSGFIQEMKSKYGAVTIGFSGWARSKSVNFGRQTDYSIPLSDHCDYNELIDMVVQSGAEKVYTVHGFRNEFAQDLRDRDIDAQALV